MRFADRADAGRRLAEALRHYRGRDPVVLALPRGGAPVAAEIALALAAPLDLVFARKLGVPVAAGTGDGGAGRRRQAGGRAQRRRDPYRRNQQAHFRRGGGRALDRGRERPAAALGERPRVEIAGHAAILVDDGVATGATARAALRSMRQKMPKTLTLAVPVASAEALASLAREVDDLVCLETPMRFGAVGENSTSISLRSRTRRSSRSWRVFRRRSREESGRLRRGGRYAITARRPRPATRGASRPGADEPQGARDALVPDDWPLRRHGGEDPRHLPAAARLDRLFRLAARRRGGGAR